MSIELCRQWVPWKNIEGDAKTAYGKAINDGQSANESVFSLFRCVTVTVSQAYKLNMACQGTKRKRGLIWRANKCTINMQDEEQECEQAFIAPHCHFVATIETKLPILLMLMLWHCLARIFAWLTLSTEYCLPTDKQYYKYIHSRKDILC